VSLRRVRYKSSGAPLWQFVGHRCHLLACRRERFRIRLAVARAKFRVTRDELQTYESAPDWARRIKRRFCPTCGSGIVNEPEVWPNQVVIGVGTLDHPGLIKPAQESGASNRAAWLRINASSVSATPLFYLTTTFVPTFTRL
jgi:hypothetical protein